MYRDEESWEYYVAKFRGPAGENQRRRGQLPRYKKPRCCLCWCCRTALVPSWSKAPIALVFMVGRCSRAIPEVNKIFGSWGPKIQDAPMADKPILWDHLPPLTPLTSTLHVTSVWGEAEPNTLCRLGHEPSALNSAVDQTEPAETGHGNGHHTRCHRRPWSYKRCWRSDKCRWFSALGHQHP